MRRILVVTVAALLVLAGLYAARPALQPERQTLSVMFPSTTSLYEGAKVKVLGVQVGTVDTITVEGTRVRVEMSYDPDVDLPADVHAIVVPPSVVGDRFVQLAPAYTDGAVLADGAELGLDRSSVPLELEDTYAALDQVAGDLGPGGANKSGALSGLISASADNLRGRGRLLNSTVRELADAISVLAGSSGDVNDTTSNLARLNRRFAASDATIRSLVVNLVAVSTELNGQGDDLAAAVSTLDRALGRVATFTRTNRRALRTTVEGLADVSGALRKRTRELEELTELAPVGLVNLLRTYVPRNWDPRDRGASVVDGRTGSQNLHAVALQDLNTQLGYTFSALCAALPPASADQLAPFCAALTAAGGDLGQVILDAYHSGGSPPGGLPLAPSTREVNGR